MLKWIFTALSVVWVIAMWYIVIYAIKRGWGPYFRSKRLGKLSVAARIKAKQGKQEVDPLTWKTEFTQKVLIFECEDGLERDYEVHDDIWDWVEVGDDGTLVYQGHLFVRFDARRPRHDLDKAYTKLTRS